MTLFPWSSTIGAARRRQGVHASARPTARRERRRARRALLGVHLAMHCAMRRLRRSPSPLDAYGSGAPHAQGAPSSAREPPTTYSASTRSAGSPRHRAGSTSTACSPPRAGDARVREAHRSSSPRAQDALERCPVTCRPRDGRAPLDASPCDVRLAAERVLRRRRMAHVPGVHHQPPRASVDLRQRRAPPGPDLRLLERARRSRRTAPSCRRRARSPILSAAPARGLTTTSKPTRALRVVGVGRRRVVARSARLAAGGAAAPTVCSTTTGEDGVRARRDVVRSCTSAVVRARSAASERVPSAGDVRNGHLGGPSRRSAASSRTQRA